MFMQWHGSGKAAKLLSLKLTHNLTVVLCGAGVPHCPAYHRRRLHQRVRHARPWTGRRKPFGGKEG